SNWIITGQLADSSPSATTVAISGGVSGNATVNSDGSFEFITGNTGSGEITVQASSVDGSTSVSAGVTTDTGSLAPYLTMNVNYGSRRAVTISGQVYDSQPAGLTVVISGAAAGTATTDFTGHYSVILTASYLGAVTAQVTNGLGLTSNAPTFVL